MTLSAVVLDWAGTTVDFGSVAPARTIERVFAEVGIMVDNREVRRDMGLPKKEHIGRILYTPRVRDFWRARFGHQPAVADLDALYDRFIPLQLACLSEYSDLIPGVLESVADLRARHLKIGTTTGYTRAMLNLLLDKSANAGYRPDCSLSPEDVGVGRPAPIMINEIAQRWAIREFTSIVKVGDTPADIQEGLNAGVWSVGVAGTGNGIGLPYDEFQALPVDDQRARLEDARRELNQAGAHYVIDTLTNLAAVLDQIETRLAIADIPFRRSAPLR